MKNVKLFKVAPLVVFVVLSSWTISDQEPEFPYQFSSRILSTLEKSTSRNRVDMAAYSFSYIGEYWHALSYFDTQYEQVKAPLTRNDSLHFEHFKPVDAKEYILQRAKNEQIVILNEAHHTPIHRVFTSTLLKDLYRMGFQYMGAETLGHEDSLLNKRKYPVLKSGYYAKEPQYGNMIREALQIGYRVFPYGANTPDEFASGKSREIAQARYIEKVLKQNPKAKIVLHCGYAHVYDVPLKNNWEKAMAGRLKEFTGIDPFTIDQQQWTELGDRAKEEPLYHLMNVKAPSVYVNAAGRTHPKLADVLTDIQVVHPRTTYRHGRPAFLLRDGQWKPCFVSKQQLSLGFPCLVLAYREGENVSRAKPLEMATPVDVIELKSATEQKALILPLGNYHVVVQSPNGNQTEFRLAHKG